MYFPDTFLKDLYIKTMATDGPVDSHLRSRDKGRQKGTSVVNKNVIEDRLVFSQFS